MNTMTKERPILFSAPMVRALLAGTKTQTRRIGKIQSPSYTELGTSVIGHRTKGSVIQATYRAYPGRGTARHAICECPYGQPGDRLWVRETFQTYQPVTGPQEGPCYRATGHHELCKVHSHLWRPSIFMRRELSRITLEIESVRAERLKSICHLDCIAEGLPDGPHRQRAYWNLWDSINGKGASDANPWVWAVTFRKL